jgi:hypothetical protein
MRLTLARDPSHNSRELSEIGCAPRHGTTENMLRPATLGAQRLHRRVLAILYAVMPVPQHAFGFLYPGVAITGVQARITPCKCLRADAAGDSLWSSSCCRSDALPGTDTPRPVCAGRRLRVAIVGAGGYIGSRLHAVLAQHCDWSVTGFDRNPRLRGGLPKSLKSRRATSQHPCSTCTRP